MGLMCTWPLGCPYINWMLIFQRCRQQLVQDRAPSREKGQPLCMAQYDRLFSSCRVPGIDQDKQRVVALRSDDNQEGHHLVVAHQGQVRNTHSHTRRHTHTHTHARTHARTHAHKHTHWWNKPQSLLLSQRHTSIHVHTPWSALPNQVNLMKPV